MGCSSSVMTRCECVTKWADHSFSVCTFSSDQAAARAFDSALSQAQIYAGYQSPLTLLRSCLELIED